MGVERGRRRVGGVVITCGSCARREGSLCSRARAVGHEIGFRAQRSGHPYRRSSRSKSRSEAPADSSADAGATGRCGRSCIVVEVVKFRALDRSWDPGGLLEPLPPPWSVFPQQRWGKDGQCPSSSFGPHKQPTHKPTPYQAYLPADVLIHLPHIASLARCVRPISVPFNIK